MRIEPPRRAPADEQRLIVLYSLMNLGPCTETQLLQFLSEMDLTNYFDMMFALNELCDRGQAARQKRKDGTYYMATVAEVEPDGSFAVEGVGPIEYITLLASGSEGTLTAADLVID